MAPARPRRYTVNVSWQTRTRTARRGAAVRTGEDEDLSIAEVCSRLDLSPRTVRYYEELGLLPGVRRRTGGRRVYGADEIERLRFIQRLKTLGLSLAEIRDLNAVHAIAGSTRAMLAHLDALLGRRLEEVGTRMEELARLRDEIEKYRGRVTSRLGALGAGHRRER